MSKWLAFVARPSTLAGALVAAVVVTAVFVGAILLMDRLIASHWLFTGDHGLVLALAVLGVNVLIGAVAVLQRARTDARPPAQTKGLRRLAGAGITFKRR